MSTFLTAIVPVFVVIAIGYGFKYYDFPGDNFWHLAARITYFAFFPALLVDRLATAQLEDVSIGLLALGLALPVLAMTALLLLAQPILRVSNPAFTSVYQGSIRFNTYIGLAAAGALYADPGLAVAAIALAILVPLVNVLSVTILATYAAQQAVSVRRVARSIFTNPLIIACAIGIVLNWSGLGLPFGTQAILDIFSRAALPMGLLTVGAGLNLAAVRASTAPVVVASALKLLLLPLLALLVCRFAGIESLTAAIVILFASLPGAPSAYILAQELGGDTQLMAAIITVQTGLALLTMPLVALVW
jgi:hypothetical protein